MYMFSHTSSPTKPETSRRLTKVQEDFLGAEGAQDVVLCGDVATVWTENKEKDITILVVVHFDPLKVKVLGTTYLQAGLCLARC